MMLGMPSAAFMENERQRLTVDAVSREREAQKKRRNATGGAG